jgi:hypothetical protein
MVADSPKSTGVKAADTLKSLILPQLDAIDQCKIRGEYKTWILNNVILPSLHFHLMVNDIPKSHIYSLQRQLTSKLKKWLHLPRRTTLAAPFYPGSLGLKFLPQFLEEAKASLLTSITYSTDAQVLECLPSLHNSHFLKSAHIPSSTVEAFQDAIDGFRANVQPAKRKRS